MTSGSTLASQSKRPAVSGGVRLKYQKENSETTLKKQWVRPPLHLAKTFQDKSWAVNLLTSATAGLLEGDFLEVDCTVGAGAKAALVSPASCRVHTMQDGNATIKQNYLIEKDAILDVWPAPLVLQKDARLRQETTLSIEESSTALLTEIMSPGRASFGESFEFTSWSSKLRIYRSGILVAYENFQLNPNQGDAADWQLRFPQGPYASIYFLTEESVTSAIEPLNELSSDTAAIGVSPLRKGGIGIKILAQDGLALRKTILTVREILIERSMVEFTDTLRRAQTFFY